MTTSEAFEISSSIILSLPTEFLCVSMSSGYHSGFHIQFEDLADVFCPSPELSVSLVPLQKKELVP